MRVKTKVPDLLQRFTPTPLVAHIRVMERTIRLETNNPMVVEHTRRALGANDRALFGEADCVWRVVTEAGFGPKATWPEMTAFSDQGLVFINIGQRGFLAADLSAREAVGFIAEDLVNDELGFRRPFLAMLFSITAPSLRLVPIWAACVARGQRGLLTFGPPGSGKTASAYVAGGLGLEFHAGQVVFLDAAAEGLRAWGEFWPVVFRPEAGLHPASVAATAQPFQYGPETLLYIDKTSSLAKSHGAVVPRCCVFLEAQESQFLRLLPLGRAEFAARLRRHCVFDDSHLGDTSLGTVLKRLQALPAYRLTYNGDYGAAAIVLRSLLTGQRMFEGLP